MYWKHLGLRFPSLIQSGGHYPIVDPVSVLTHPSQYFADAYHDASLLRFHKNTGGTDHLEVIDRTRDLTGLSLID